MREFTITAKIELDEEQALKLDMGSGWYLFEKLAHQRQRRRMGLGEIYELSY